MYWQFILTFYKNVGLIKNLPTSEKRIENNSFILVGI